MLVSVMYMSRLMWWFKLILLGLHHHLPLPKLLFRLTSAIHSAAPHPRPIHCQHTLMLNLKPSSQLHLLPLPPLLPWIHQPLIGLKMRLPYPSFPCSPKISPAGTFLLFTPVTPTPSALHHVEITVPDCLLKIVTFRCLNHHFSHVESHHTFLFHKQLLVNGLFPSQPPLHHYHQPWPSIGNLIHISQI